MSSSKTKWINWRRTPLQGRRLMRAAELVGKTPADFKRDAILKQAQIDAPLEEVREYGA